MKRHWNLSLFTGFVVAVFAFLSYFLYFAYFPLTRDFPWVNLLFFVGGFALLGAGLKRAYREPERYRGKVSGPILTALSVLILVFFLFYNFSFSQQLPASKGAPTVGEKAPDFTLPDKDGKPVTLSKLLEVPADAPTDAPRPWVLLVFYRGYW